MNQVKRESGLILARSVLRDPSAVVQYLETMGKVCWLTVRGVKNAEHGKAIAMTCLMEGITPLEFDLRYHLVDGRPSKQATAIQAEFESAGGRIEWQNIGDDGQVAKARFIYGHHDMVVQYTAEEGKAQVGGKFDKDGGNWKTNRGAMLRARLVTKALRIVAPGIVAGIYSPDELGDDAGEILDAEYQVESKPQAESAAGGGRDPVPAEQEDDIPEDLPPEDQGEHPEVAAANEERRKLEEKGRELLKDNVGAENTPELRDSPTPPATPNPAPAAPAAEEKPPESPAQPPPDMVTPKTLKRLRVVVEGLGKQDSFKEHLKRLATEHKIDAPAANRLTEQMASDFISKLEPLLEAQQQANEGA